MKHRATTALVTGIALFIISCQSQTKSTEKTNPTAASDSVKAVLNKIIGYSNKLDFESAFQYYSTDADARFVENGVIFPSVAAIREAYREFLPIIEVLENTVKDWNIVSINDETVFATAPIHAKIKTKGRPEHEFDYVWSALAQKRNGKWVLVQTHESWANAGEVMAAIMPAPAATQ